MVTVSVAGCGSEESGTPEPAAAENPDPGARTSQQLWIEADESQGETEWTSVGANYPEAFTVEEAAPEDVGLGVDTSWNGEPDETFDEEQIEGIETDQQSFRIDLDTGHTLAEGDFVFVEYPAIVNPDESGGYEIEVTLNESQTETFTLEIGGEAEEEETEPTPTTPES